MEKTADLPQVSDKVVFSSGAPIIGNIDLSVAWEALTR
jgi:serine acetyltransferase